MRKITVTAAILIASWAQASPRYRGGAVATAHPVATRAALSALDQGGNAVDAAIAAALALAVVGPYDSGLGGGGFALVHDASGEHVLDFREVAPKAASRDMFVRNGKADPELSLDGALAVAVPGASKGYVELHKRYGKLPLEKVAAPAIAAAKQGVVVTPELFDMIDERKKCLEHDADATRIFLTKENGKWAAPRPGALLVQADLARTLSTLAKEGDAPFFKGEIAKAIVETVSKKGGILTAEDLAGYKTREHAPLEGRYLGHRVVTMPPPSAGGLVVLQTLGLLERLQAKPLASREPQALHFYIEALKRSFVDRFRYLGDPAFVQIPLERLLSAPHLDALAASIDPRKAASSTELLSSPEGGSLAADAGSKNQKHTTHISVVDKDGNAVALTTTVNWTFGSCLVARGTGIVLNDQMDDFTAQADAKNVFGLIQGEQNSIAPGKVPLSSMSPTIVFQKDKPSAVRLVVGSPGGSKIPTTVVQVVNHVLEGKLDVAAAVAMGKVHHQLQPESVRITQGSLDPKTQAALEAMGHTFKKTEHWGNVQAVAVDPETGLRSAASDPNEEGLALGQE